jgi:hypothetical protein
VPGVESTVYLLDEAHIDEAHSETEMDLFLRHKHTNN